MAKVYSTQLFSVIDLGLGTTEVALVPDGVVWVIRHMTARYEATNTTPLNGFEVETADGAPLWNVGPLGVAFARTYDYSGRQVLNAGQAVNFKSDDDANWALLGSGYTLTLP